MAATDPAAWSGETTGSIPVQTLAGESYGSRTVDEWVSIDGTNVGLWFVSGRGPDASYRVTRVDNPLDPIYAKDGDRDNRDRHLLRAMLRHALDMLDGEDNS